MTNTRRKKKEPPRLIPPPPGAPYLAGLAQIPDELLATERQQLSPTQELEVRRFVRRLKEQIFAFRRAYEKKYNVVIVPEPPRQP